MGLPLTDGVQHATLKSPSPFTLFSLLLNGMRVGFFCCWLALSGDRYGIERTNTMSPASLDASEVERYIGACLFSQNRSKYFGKSNNAFQRAHIYPQNGYVNFQNCPSVQRWAGGAPLISFAGHHRGSRIQIHEDLSNNHLARLAVHTQGAPLILAKSYNHRKNKPQKNNQPSINVVQQTKVFENSNNKKHFKTYEPTEDTTSAKGVDSISVTSDESCGSQSSETCLPRIIKPRKRRKKDRKPPTHLNNSHHIQDEISRDSFISDVDSSSSANISPYLPFLESIKAYQSSLKLDKSKQCFDLLGDISETPKLHHSFEEVEEVKDVNGNQSVSTCQCRYCDPKGQIWDIDRSCYSPFLTPPKSFDFSSSLSSSYLSQSPDIYNISHRLSMLSLKDEKYKSSFSRSTSSSSTSSSSSSGDLEVSTEIVTSLNGHRDIEIKFWLSGAVESKTHFTNLM